MKTGYGFTLRVEYDNTAEGTTDDLMGEAGALQRAVHDAIANRVPRTYRGAVRVSVVAAELTDEGK